MAPPRDPRITLEQMLEAIQDIEQVTAGQGFEAYATDRPLRRLIERCIEIVSEASRRLPRASRRATPISHGKDC